jgi:alkyldihydroxyacetonephosphate synthase
MVEGRRKHWGWGYEHEQPPPDEVRSAASFLASRLGFGSTDPEAPVPLSELTLPPPRLEVPAHLAHLCAADDYERAFHTYGSSYRDVVRGFRGRFDHPPDVVAHPTDESEIEAVLEWALGENAAVIPFGGGTSVVGGVEPVVDAGRFDGVVTIDLRRLDRVLEVEAESLSARIAAGASGSVLEDQLRGHGLTLRHFPQSFQFATLGGMIATTSPPSTPTSTTSCSPYARSRRRARGSHGGCRARAPGCPRTGC